MWALHFTLLMLYCVRMINSQTTHECNRPCVEGGKTKTCRYKFDVQWYLTMSKACYNCPFDQTDCFKRDCVPGKFVWFYFVSLFPLRMIDSI